MAVLTDRCAYCNSKVRFDIDEEEWEHAFSSRSRQNHKPWPKGVPLTPETLGWGEDDFAAYLRQGRSSAQLGTTPTDLEIERLERRVELLKKFPSEDPFEDEDVIFFTKVLGGRSWNYVAMKSDGLYHLTGKLQKEPKSWPQLVAFMTDGNLLGKVWINTGWVEMVIGETV